MKKYFQGIVPVKKRDLIESFKGRVWGDNDEDALKFAILYLIHTFVCSGEKNCKSVPRKNFDLVESGQYKDYPWGKRAFYVLLKSISKKMNFSKKYYRIHSMPLVMQVWLYECSSSGDLKIVQKQGSRIPRLLNWKTLEAHPLYKPLMREIFSDLNNQLNFKNITPSPREVAVL